MGTGTRLKSWHGDPLYFAGWFNQRWPGRYQELMIRAREMRVINWEKRWSEIQNYGGEKGQETV